MLVAMPGLLSKQIFASGVNSGVSTNTLEPGGDVDEVAFEINVTAVGGTPTMTVQVEGSLDGTNFVVCRHVPNDSETVASAQTYTTTGRRYLFVTNHLGQFYRVFRLNVTANTNVTFDATAFANDEE